MFGFSKAAESTALAPLPGAPTRVGGGPTIAGFRAEAVPTLPANAAEMMQHAPPNKCIRKGCGGQLCVVKGVVKVDAGNGVIMLEDSDRVKKWQSYVCCSRCGCPVPVNHPMQAKLDAGWQEQEARARQEGERASRQAAASPPKAAPINQALSLPDAVNSAHDLIMRLRADVERLTQRVAALEKARTTPADF
jgi:hypothetical protein